MTEILIIDLHLKSQCIFLQIQTEGIDLAVIYCRADLMDRCATLGVRVEMLSYFLVI